LSLKICMNSIFISPGQKFHTFCYVCRMKIKYNEINCILTLSRRLLFLIFGLLLSYPLSQQIRSSIDLQYAPKRKSHFFDQVQVNTFQMSSFLFSLHIHTRPTYTSTMFSMLNRRVCVGCQRAMGAMDFVCTVCLSALFFFFPVQLSIIRSLIIQCSHCSIAPLFHCSIHCSSVFVLSAKKV